MLTSSNYTRLPRKLGQDGYEHLPQQGSQVGLWPGGFGLGVGGGEANLSSNLSFLKVTPPWIAGDFWVRGVSTIHCLIPESVVR
jgi:hypothetical protein